MIVQDAGRAINPAAVAGQMMGGAVQGVGMALYEQMVWDADGTPVAASFQDYGLPNAEKSPRLETAIVEVPSTIGPFGARPVGEPPIIPAPAAVANAVSQAARVRVADLPITSERLWRALSGA